MLAEKIGDGGDGRAAALHQGIAVARVADGRLQHVAQAHGAVVAQDQHVGLERAGHARRQQTRARHDVEAEVIAKMRDGGARRRRALAAHDDGLARLGVPQHRGDVATGTAQVRLYHLQREGGCHAGIEGVAATLENRHADRRADPVRGGDDAERAVDLGPRRERPRVDVGHGAPPLPAGFGNCRRVGGGWFQFNAELVLPAPLQEAAGFSSSAMHAARPCCQCGRRTPKVRSSLLQSRRELAGRAASVGYSAVVMGITGTCGVPSRAPARTIAPAKPCHVVSPPAAM